MNTSRLALQGYKEEVSVCDCAIAVSRHIWMSMSHMNESRLALQGYEEEVSV